MSRRLAAVLATLAKAVVALVLVVLVLVGVAIAVLETGWAKERIRRLLVRQANEYLTATLDIGRLGGSLLRGIELEHITLSREGRPIVQIDALALSYSIRELVQPGVVIKRVRITRPTVVAERVAGGQWNLASIVRREAQESGHSGPGRPIEVQSIEIQDATVRLHDPLQFGPVHLPTAFDHLDAAFSFSYAPVRWHLAFARASWRGSAPEFNVNRFSGAIDSARGVLTFANLRVETPRSAFTYAGRIDRSQPKTTLDLQVHADRFAFQEWAGLLHGLDHIAVEAAFDTTLQGPTSHIDTRLRLQSKSGAIDGTFVLDSSVPGWRGAGTVTTAKLDLGDWLNRPDCPSDISGTTVFTLDLGLGEHFPRGTYRFDGSHAMYMDYAGDDVHAKGRITDREVVVETATARAYGAAVSLTAGTIGLKDPFPYAFRGRMTSLDLRRIPASIPVPRVESLLALDYDVGGRFVDAFIAGHAAFSRSMFLGATIGDGTVGSIDTSMRPITYSGDGEIDGVDIARFGDGLDVGWMKDPRYAATISGRFHVEGANGGDAPMALHGGGRIARGSIFGGTVADADVSIDIANGTLRASYAGPFSRIDPKRPFADERFAGLLSGTADVRVAVRDLLARSPALPDYAIDGTIELKDSTARGIQIDRGRADGQLRDGVLALRSIDVAAPAIGATGSGRVALTPEGDSDFQYDVQHADLAAFAPLIGRMLDAQMQTKGRLWGPRALPRVAGSLALDRVSGGGVEALSFTGSYDATVPPEGRAALTLRVDGRATFVKVAGQTLREAKGSIGFDRGALDFDLALSQIAQQSGTIKGSARLDADNRTAALTSLAVSLGPAQWRLQPQAAPASISWTGDGLTVGRLAMVAGVAGDQRLDVDGTWRRDGHGRLHVVAAHVFLDSLQSAGRPPRYGGVLDLDATLGGTLEAPVVEGRIQIAEGRVQRVSYQRLAGRVDLNGDMLAIDLRLDQAPGVWATAIGQLPLAVFDRSRPERAIDVAIQSSPINLGLLEGLTTVVRNVGGEIRLDVRAIGTSRDPHFSGRIEIANAAFVVTSSGSRYKNGRVQLALSADRVGVETLHLEDSGGRPLDVHGSLATHELSVGNLEIDLTAQHFEVLKNEFGNVDVDATLRFRGRFETPKVSGDIAIQGGNLKVDEILERTLFQPYATEETKIADVDAVAALNPWSRLALDLALHVPETLRLTGQNVQVSAGTPIGLGDINLRVGGDLYLYKDPGEQLYVTGSLDSVAGTYSFQGRRFDIDEAASSINFRGDLNPELYVSVTRSISGVLTRVTISGPLHNPQLRLASVPPLEPSDILSLIVFNSSTSDLSAGQQQELAVRAGAIAAGFLATPLVSALQQSLGLESLEVEPSGDLGTGPKVTIGEELAPGLIARFSRQFGEDEYDQATVEYYLSRILRIRATFSDAQSLIARSPFRRIERAGMNLIFFFSF